jgi:hypothetical protein
MPVPVPVPFFRYFYQQLSAEPLAQPDTRSATNQTL